MRKASGITPTTRGKYLSSNQLKRCNGENDTSSSDVVYLSSPEQLTELNSEYYVVILIITPKKKKKNTQSQDVLLFASGEI